MRPQPTARHSLTPRTFILLTLAALTVASCADPTTVSRVPTRAPMLDELPSEQPDVVINDEVWVDPTIQTEPFAEIPVPETDASEATFAEPSFSVAVAPNLEQERTIRVGVVYVDLNATTVRMSGGPVGDTYELHGGAATGPLLASGLSGDAVATITGSGTARQIRLALPNNTTLTTPNPVVLVSASGLVRVRRTTTDATIYRGTAEVRFNAARTFLIGVNELPIEQYIKGVVPRELGPIAFPEVEAQKAQAVTARTFARRRIQFCPASRCTNGYHIIPTTSDQVYGGMTAEHPMSSAAVDGTRGVVATSGGGLIDALYSSTSGGFTANSEDVFANPFSYLRGVPDHERGEALDHVPTLEVFQRHGNPTNLRNHANGDFEADWSIYHRWYVHWTNEEMRQVVGRVQSTSFVDPGAISSITITKRASSGRALEIEFVTEKRGTLRATKDAIRSALRYVTYTSTGGLVLNSLRSTLVFVEPEVDPKTKTVIGWEAWGGGWGHGVGMSQTGAVGMAEKGHTYEEILEHYYQGVRLEQRW